jgi:hypothetical protein
MPARWHRAAPRLKWRGASCGRPPWRIPGAHRPGGVQDAWGSSRSGLHPRGAARRRVPPAISNRSQSGCAGRVRRGFLARGLARLGAVRGFGDASDTPFAAHRSGAPLRSALLRAASAHGAPARAASPRPPLAPLSPSLRRLCERGIRGHPGLGVSNGEAAPSPLRPARIGASTSRHHRRFAPSHQTTSTTINNPGKRADLKCCCRLLKLFPIQTGRPYGCAGGEEF